ncbi:MAG TPA: chloride channel protein [Candidatus Limnocylindria bacterium]|jgi:H+/Cl- antiporter ClcA|nr:chloride channel protein [Candidatus Limnocylindria bacterium]
MNEASGRWLVRLSLFGAVIGIPAALLAVVFFTLVHELEHLLWTDLPAALGETTAPWYLVVGLPVVGAIIVAATRILLPGNGGHSPMDGISAIPTSPRAIPGVALAALGTLGFGLVLGPEAPVMALGSAVGVALTSLVRTTPRETGVLSTAGQFSAISSLFGGPLVAGVMLTEGGIGAGRALIGALLPGFVAAALGYLIFVGVGAYTGTAPPGLTVPDLEPYIGTTVPDLLMAVALGVAIAVVMVGVRRLAEWIHDGGQRLLGESNAGVTIGLVAGGLAVGLLALGAGGLGANPQDVLFSGQQSIPAVVAQPSVMALVILLVAKALAYVISLASGFRGGPIFPALFIGIGVADFAVQLFGMSPTLAIAVGAAAAMTAQTRLVVTSMVFSALLVGSAGADAIPAAVLATVAAYVTATAFDRRTSEAAAPNIPASDATPPAAG